MEALTEKRVSYATDKIRAKRIDDRNQLYSPVVGVVTWGTVHPIS